MLRKFSVENYKNFQNKVELDLTKTHEYKFNEMCVKDGILNKMLLMGKNASGKTNLGYALFDIVCTLTDNMLDPHQIDEGSFINALSNKNEAIFTYEFQNKGDIITYEYKKISPRVITYEKLMINEEKIFEFDFKKKKSDVVGLDKIGAKGLSFTLMDGSLSVLRFIGNNTPQPEGTHVHFIMDFARRMLYFRSCHDGNTFIGFSKNTELLDQFIIRNGYVKDFEKFLNNTAKLNMKLDVVKAGPNSYLVQKFKDKSLIFNPIISSGTHSLELYYFWSKVFDKVSFLYIDEFDAYYHYELAIDIIKHTKEHVSSQVILTSHNTGLVDNELMRPDCYLQIKGCQIESFADSTSRELRQGHNIEKMLRNGEFDV